MKLFESPPLDLLKTFVVFAQSQSIHDAALKLQVSQPAVSIQLKRLEKYFPYPLFMTHGKRKIVSHYGRDVFESIKFKITDLEKIIRDVNQSYLDPMNVGLKIGCRNELYSRVTKTLNLPCRIEFVNSTSTEAIDQITHGRIDIAIAHQVPDSEHVIAKKIFTDHARLVSHKKWIPKGQKLQIQPEFLTQTPSILYRENDPPYFMELLGRFKLGPKDLQVKMICEHWYATLAMVQMGLGYSVIPSGIPIFDPDIVSLDIPTKIVAETDFYVLYHTSLRKLKFMRELLE